MLFLMIAVAALRGKVLDREGQAVESFPINQEPIWIVRVKEPNKCPVAETS